MIQNLKIVEEFLLRIHCKRYILRAHNTLNPILSQSIKMKIILIILIGIAIISYSFKIKQEKEFEKHYYAKVEHQDSPKIYLTKYATQIFDISLFTSIHSIYNQVILPIGGFVVIVAGLMCLNLFKHSKIIGKRS